MNGIVYTRMLNKQISKTEFIDFCNTISDLCFKKSIIDERQKMTVDAVVEDNLFDTFPVYSEHEFIKILNYNEKNINYNYCIRQALKNLCPLVEIYKYVTSTKKVSIVTVPTTSKLLLTIYTNDKKISRVVSLAKKVGLLIPHCSTYRFGKSGYARTWYWNKKMEKVLLSLFKKYDITFDRLNLKSNTEKIEELINNIEVDNNKFIGVEQRCRISNMSDKEVRAAFYTFNPQCREMELLMDEDNKFFGISDRDYVNLNIKRDKNRNVISTSYRKTSRLCTAKAHNITSEDLSGKSSRLIRSKELKRILGNEYYENDVKSSIYRINYLLTHDGKWVDDSIDFYEHISGFKLYGETRNIFKRFCMTLYFCSSIEEVIKNITFKNNELKKYLELKNGIKIVTHFFNNMRHIIGDTYQSEIFMHESCIYTYVAHALRLSGYKTVQVYDGFYTDKYISSTDFNKIVKQAAEYYYSLYKNYFRQPKHITNLFNKKYDFNSASFNNSFSLKIINNNIFIYKYIKFNNSFNDYKMYIDSFKSFNNSFSYKKINNKFIKLCKYNISLFDLLSECTADNDLTCSYIDFNKYNLINKDKSYKDTGQYKIPD